MEQVPIGVPYELPFIESNAGNALSHTFLTKKLNGEGLVRWNQGNNSSVQGMVPADSDNGYLYMEGEAVGDKAALVSGKINLANAINPMLSIAYVGFSGDKNRIGITIVCNGEEKLLEEWETSASTASWQEKVMSLDEYRGQTIQFILYGELRTSTRVFADLIQIIDYPDIDLAVSGITAPSSLKVGASGQIKALIENKGLNTVSNYMVNLYNNDQCICTIKSTEELQSRGQAIYSFDVNATPLSDDVMNVYVMVTTEGDAVQANNKSSEKTIIIEKSQLPAPQNLTAVKTANGDIKLTWEDADLTALANGYITENCENYESFSIDGFGEWTTIDADKSISNAFSTISVPHLGSEAIGFMLFDCADAKFNTTFNGHSGCKYFMAFTNQAQKMDDWLISPELNGKAQTISFFARGYHPDYPESFEILYSTTGKEITDFKAVAIYNNVGYTFTEYTAQLPEGSTYFAIRCTSTNGMMFIVDDITYAPKSYNIKIEGYNVYRNGDLIASNVPTKEYRDLPETGNLQVYNVTAVYNYGESA
ncbi:MAG: choice-of-anchor J domain-containing protein, partial [Muribaculaceae bacterium]|nr:choice-of-anchor J domain-containing protein [Muribaculaceae bacterium]